MQKVQISKKKLDIKTKKDKLLQLQNNSLLNNIEKEAKKYSRIKFLCNIIKINSFRIYVNK